MFNAALRRVEEGPVSYTHLDVYKRQVIELASGAPDAAQKTAFCGQEIAKLREQVRNLEKGVSRQRAWARGKQM